MMDTRLNEAQKAKLRQTIGSLMRDARSEQSLSIDGLVERSGLNKAQVSRMENGHVMPTLPTLAVWCHALGFSLASVAQDLGL